MLFSSCPIIYADFFFPNWDKIEVVVRQEIYIDYCDRCKIWHANRFRIFFFNKLMFFVSYSREFTHRVKSVSMAKFTSQEVEALQNGGNQVNKLLIFHFEAGFVNSHAYRISSLFSVQGKYI